jgi:hypothetical protein
MQSHNLLILLIFTCNSIIMPSNQPVLRVFEREIHENKIVFQASGHFSDENYRIAASQIPVQLQQSGLSSPEEDDSVEYTALDHLPRYLHQDGCDDLIYQFFPEDRLHALDIFEELKA